MDDERRRWTGIDRMSCLGEFAEQLDGLPDDAATLCRIVHGVLIHLDWLPAYGLDETSVAPIVRETVPVLQRLRTAVGMADGPIDRPRPPAHRVAGTCRDFALMLCSFLRHKGVPARLRCGFGSYFVANWHDHWVCEYWDVAAGSWRLADAQIDDVLRARHSIAFDPADVPRTAFMTADHAWLHCRAGRSNFRRFGSGETTGRWFVHVNVARDRLALHDRVASSWDEWRTASEPQRRLDASLTASTDEWARFPDRFDATTAPGWLGQQGRSAPWGHGDD